MILDRSLFYDYGIILQNNVIDSTPTPSKILDMRTSA